MAEVQFSSVRRAGVQGTEALSSLQQPRVRVTAWGPLLCVTPPLSLSTCSLSVFSCSVNKGKKAKKYI